MFINNIAFKGICTIILFITMGISQVKLEIQNVNTAATPSCTDPQHISQPLCEAAAACVCPENNDELFAECASNSADQGSCESHANAYWAPNWSTGTLDIYMTNTIGCSACDDPLYDTKLLCEVNGNNTAGGAWTFDASIDAATCAGVCSIGAHTDRTSCTDDGTCFDNTYSTKKACEAVGECDDQTFLDKVACEAGEGTWTPREPSTWTSYTWTTSTMNGVYFDGEVAGFQFYLDGINATGISGGTAAQYLDLLEYVPQSEKFLGVSASGGVIPAGSGVLATISFSLPKDGICFRDQYCTAQESCDNEVSDVLGISVNPEFGGCYCVSDTDVGGPDGVCDLEDNCPTVQNADQLDIDGDGAGDVCDVWYYDANNDQDTDGVPECTLLPISECNKISDVQNDNCPNLTGENATADQTDTDGDKIGDACDTCIYDSTNDTDGDGVCYCTLTDCSAVPGIIDNCRAIANADQLDTDADGADGVGDACDNCPLLANAPSDHDGITSTPDIQLDADTDGVGDVCDNCAANKNANQLDTDADGTGDVCDNCSAIINEDQADADFDFVGDACDVCADYDDSDDDDNDEVPNGCDACVDTAIGATVDLTGCEAAAAISQIGSNLPAEFSISQNFPNPFNPITSITFDVAEMDEVSLIVYDLTGKEVVTLVSNTYTPGTYNVEWNAVNNAGDGIVSGMYIYRYTSSEKAITRKMLYLK